jgi:Holliday junction resolvase
MSTATKGRRAEHRARNILRDAGYQVTRAAGSKGPADLIAWNTAAIRFISVKRGTVYLSSVEREALMLGAFPPNSTVECWRFPLGCREPLIEVLR